MTSGSLVYCFNVHIYMYRAVQAERGYPTLPDKGASVRDECNVSWTHRERR